MQCTPLQRVSNDTIEMQLKCKRKMGNMHAYVFVDPLSVEWPEEEEKGVGKNNDVWQKETTSFDISKCDHLCVPPFVCST